MVWWHFLVAIPVALFLVNGIPHFTQGVAGKRFPSPFTGGPPKLDSPVNNVYWGAGNLIVGGLLLWVIRDGLANWLLVLELVVIGVAAAALLANIMSKAERE
ncbi:MAG: hypothetical protein JWR75_1891 [Devosia sp.]|nr:hypothetical protein [Devosia sp.]